MSKPHLAEVVTMRETNASDIVQMLRDCANSIESGEVPVSSITAVVEQDDGIVVYGWGHTDTYRSIALLQAGALQLTQRLVE